MAVSKEHCELLAAVGAAVDKEWAKHGKHIAGEQGYRAMHMRGLQWAHPCFPIFMYGLGIMPALSNGAKVNLWGHPDSLAMVVLNINHSQTRTAQDTLLGFPMLSSVTAISAGCWSRGKFMGEEGC